ncbi:Hypothetical predicted protein [Pelobates cultripes]|uniref:Uncharacterized protein n=1 Tax=Pelobates cultripes TaxID=61616 RepID=A0AAD1WS69_PELCU|nr:Hypothetical predicted protein [Pelobates cultripes]
MGAMLDNLSHSISNAILASKYASGLTLPKATKKTHYMVKHTSKSVHTDRLRPVTIDDVVPLRKRATHRAKMVQTWKRAKSLTDSSDSGSESEEVSDSAILDPEGEALFNPNSLQNPRSAEWYHTDHVAKYIAARIRELLENH